MIKNKPILYANKPVPLNDLSYREFEELIYHLIKKRIEDGKYINMFDDADLLSGVGEKGRDIILYKNKISVGIIQCKKYKKRISEIELCKELIKFILYYIKDKKLIPNINNFVYYIAASSGYTDSTIDLIKDIKNYFSNNGNLSIITNQIIKKYKSLSDLSFINIKEELKNILFQIKLEKIPSDDINLWIQNYYDVKRRFFTIDQITLEDFNYLLLKNKPFSNNLKNFEKSDEFNKILKTINDKNKKDLIKKITQFNKNVLDNNDGDFVFYYDKRGINNFIIGYLFIDNQVYIRHFNLNTKIEMLFLLKYSKSNNNFIDIEDFKIIYGDLNIKNKFGVSYIEIIICDLLNIFEQEKRLNKKNLYENTNTIVELEHYTLIYDFVFWVPIFNLYEIRLTGKGKVYYLVNLGNIFKKGINYFFNFRMIPEAKNDIKTSIDIKLNKEKVVNIDNIYFLLDDNWNLIENKMYQNKNYQIIKNNIRYSSLTVEKIINKKQKNVYFLIKKILLMQLNYIIPETVKLSKEKNIYKLELDILDYSTNEISKEFYIIIRKGINFKLINFSAFRNVYNDNFDYFNKILSNYSLV